jgi:hypothetical protein
MADNSSPFKLFWPEIDDLPSARDAARIGAYGAWVVALFSVGSLAFQYFGGASMPQDLLLSGTVFVLLFAGLGFGVWKLSRACAVIALVLYAIDSLSTLLLVRNGLSVVGIAFLLLFISGTRGTFAWHKYSKQAETQPSES